TMSSASGSAIGVEIGAASGGVDATTTDSGELAIEGDIEAVQGTFEVDVTDAAALALAGGDAATAVTGPAGTLGSPIKPWSALRAWGLPTLARLRSWG
ncbi:MAG TPA: hypothetical protein VFM74_05035, partial [Candidatus Limnocylindria bacterium]|nr:hypothetical protein [Candidatus Limnocylindria bacterium]